MKQRLDWEDIVFEKRNKEYGAYMLRKKYPPRLVERRFNFVAYIGRHLFLSHDCQVVGRRRGEGIAAYAHHQLFGTGDAAPAQ